jgi:hypothetical protein
MFAISGLHVAPLRGSERWPSSKEAGFWARRVLPMAVYERTALLGEGWCLRGARGAVVRGAGLRAASLPASAAPAARLPSVGVPPGNRTGGSALAALTPAASKAAGTTE